MWGATPIDQLMCRIEFRRLRYDGIYTPQGMDGIIGYPAFDGVSDWGGGLIDPAREVMVLNTMTLPFKIRLFPRSSAEGETDTGGSHVEEAPSPKRGLNYYPQIRHSLHRCARSVAWHFPDALCCTTLGPALRCRFEDAQAAVEGDPRDLAGYRPLWAAPAAAVGDRRAKHRRCAGDTQRIDLYRCDD
jgi:hypothetical protein